MNEMFITPIQPARFVNGANGVNGVDRIDWQENTQKIEGQNGVSTFRGIFDEVVGNVKTTEEDLVNKQYLLATGQIEDAHSVTIAASQAQIAVDMLVSLRNKAMESYNELMRISL